MSNTPKWTTKDKQRIPIAEMSESHLRNTHKMMARRLAEVTCAIDEAGWTEENKLIEWRVNRWVMVLTHEHERRGIAIEYTHPNTVIVMPEYNGTYVTMYRDAPLLLEYIRLSKAAGIVQGMLGCEPHGDMAQDVFDREFDEAMDMELKAEKWLAVFKCEVDIRGLVIEAWDEYEPDGHLWTN